MFNPGDVLRVILPIRGQLEMGQEMIAAERQPANEQYCRVKHPQRGDMLFRSRRFEPAGVQAAPPQPRAEDAVPPVPLKVPGVFQVGDEVVIARGEQPNHVQGINHEMRAIVGNGRVYAIEHIAGEEGRQHARLHDERWTWDVRMLDHAPGVPVAAVPAPHRQFQVGDIVRIAREYDFPDAKAGWVGPMARDIGAAERRIERIDPHGHIRIVGNQWNWDPRSLDFVRGEDNGDAIKVGPIAPDDFVVGMHVKCIRGYGPLREGAEYPILSINRREERVRVEHGNGAWNMDRFHYADQPAAIIPQAPVKQGPIAREDVVPGMKAMFVGGGTMAGVGDFVIGTVYEVMGHYPHVEDAWFILRDGNQVGCYRNNFIHVPPEDIKVIVVGSRVRVVDAKNTDLHMRQVYTVKSINGTNCVLDQFPGKLFALRRFASVGDPAAEKPNPIIKFEDVRTGMYFKLVNTAGVPDEAEHMVGDGKYYRIADVDRDDDTIYCRDISWIPKSACEFYEREGKFIAPPPKPKVERSLREIFKEKQGGVYHGSLVSFAYRTVGGQNVTNIRYICYAPIRTAGAISELIIGAIPMVEQVKDNGADALDNFRRYINYVVNESPWADCFITKDLDEAVDAGFVMNTKKTLSQAISGAVAARQGHEYYCSVPTFLHFVDKGYSGNVAFMMSMIARMTEKKGAVVWTRTSMGNNHHCIDSGSGTEEILSFFAKGFPEYGDVPCEKNREAYQLFKAIDKNYMQPRNQSFNDFAKEKIKEIIVGEGWDKDVSLDAKSMYDFADTLTKLIKEQK